MGIIWRRWRVWKAWKVWRAWREGLWWARVLQDSSLLLDAEVPPTLLVAQWVSCERHGAPSRNAVHALELRQERPRCALRVNPSLFPLVIPAANLQHHGLGGWPCPLCGA